jgi:hypothetical protein
MGAERSREEVMRALSQHDEVAHVQPCVCRICEDGRSTQVTGGEQIVRARVGNDRARNHFVFAKSEQIKDTFNTTKLSMFAHVNGCVTCRHLYQHVQLQDGREVHVYHNGKKEVDEVQVALAPPCAAPTTLQGVRLDELPGCSSLFAEALSPPQDIMTSTHTSIPTIGGGSIA